LYVLIVKNGGLFVLLYGVCVNWIRLLKEGGNTCKVNCKASKNNTPKVVFFESASA